MKNLLPYLLVLFVGVISGCQSPAPIDLVNPQSPPPIIVQPPELASNLSATTSDVDSSFYFPALNNPQFAQLTIEGAIYDGPSQHQTATIARAIFFDPATRFVLGTDTLFKTVMPASVLVDSFKLEAASKDFQVPSTGQTIMLGNQLLLFNNDGSGGDGIAYQSSHQYHWSVTGGKGIPSFQTDFTSPPQIQVTTSPLTTLNSSTDAAFHWKGGGATVKIDISSVDARGYPTAPLFHLLITENHGSTTIPKEVLSILPHNQTEFLFTFSSATTESIHVSGYSDAILVQVVTSHNLLLHIRS
jgi:hypothetical protein